MWSADWEGGRRIQFCKSGSVAETNPGWTTALKSTEPLPTAKEYLDWYLKHVAAFPQYLQRRKYPDQPAMGAGEDWLSVQVWMNMVLAAQAAKDPLKAVTDSIAASGDYAEIIQNHQLVLADNSQSEVRERAFLNDFLKQVNPEDYSIRVVTMNQHMSSLRTENGEKHGVFITFAGWSGVNVFSAYWFGEVCGRPAPQPNSC